jgi:hypothetical protein
LRGVQVMVACIYIYIQSRRDAKIQTKSIKLNVQRGGSYSTASMRRQNEKGNKGDRTSLSLRPYALIMPWRQTYLYGDDGINKAWKR